MSLESVASNDSCMFGLKRLLTRGSIRTREILMNLSELLKIEVLQYVINFLDPTFRLSMASLTVVGANNYVAMFIGVVSGVAVFGDSSSLWMIVGKPTFVLEKCLPVELLMMTSGGHLV